MPSVFRRIVLDKRIRDWLRKERQDKNKPYWEILYEVFQELKDTDFHTKHMDIQDKKIWMVAIPLDVDRELQEDASKRGLLGEFYKYINLLLGEKLGLTTDEETRPKKRNINFRLSKSTYELLRLNKGMGSFTRFSQVLEKAIAMLDYDTLERLVEGRERELQKGLTKHTSNLLYEDTIKKIDMLRTKYESETGIRLTRSLVIEAALKNYFEHRRRILTGQGNGAVITALLIYVFIH